MSEGRRSPQTRNGILFADSTGISKTKIGSSLNLALKVTKIKDQGAAPEIVMVATGPVEREFREVDRRTEIGARWTEEGIESAARLLEEGEQGKVGEGILIVLDNFESHKAKEVAEGGE